MGICIFDGKLSEEVAKQIALDELIKDYGEGVKDVFKQR